MRSDNLKRHAKICQQAKSYEPYKAVACKTTKKEVTGILEELLRQGGISIKRYQDIKDEHNIM